MKYNGSDLPPELEQSLLAHFSQPKNSLATITPMKAKFTSGDNNELPFGLAIVAVSATITFLLLWLL